MKKLTMLASVAAVALSASAFAATVEHKTEAKHGHKHHDYKAVKEVKTDVVAVAADVAAPQDFYATFGAGYGKFKVGSTKKNKPTFMIGFGKQLDNQVRADLTVDVNSKVTKNSVTYKSWDVMANAYYHFDDMASVSPYATAGLGYAKQKVSGGVKSGKKGGVAYQAGFGVSTKMSDKMTFDLGYRFFKPKTVKIEGLKLKAHAHKIMAAIRMPL